MLQSLTGYVETNLAFVAIQMTCLCAGTAFWFLPAPHRASRADRAVDAGSPAHPAIATTLSLLQDAETGQRGFLLPGREAYLEPYDQARMKIDGCLALLRSDDSERDLAAEARAGVIHLERATLSVKGRRRFRPPRGMR